MRNPFDLPSVDTREDEEDRERKWAFFEIAIREFADSEPDGYGAVLRAVSRAMNDQQELIRK